MAFIITSNKHTLSLFLASKDSLECHKTPTLQPLPVWKSKVSIWLPLIPCLKSLDSNKWSLGCYAIKQVSFGTREFLGALALKDKYVWKKFQAVSRSARMKYHHSLLFHCLIRLIPFHCCWVYLNQGDESLCKTGFFLFQSNPKNFNSSNRRNLVSGHGFGRKNTVLLQKKGYRKSSKYWDR